MASKRIGSVLVIATLLAQLTLSACVPIASTFYEPHGNGKLVITSCFMGLYAPLYVDIGLRTKMSTMALMPDEQSPSSRLHLALVIYPGETVRFESRNVVIITDHGAVSRAQQLQQLDVDYVAADPEGGPPRLTKQDALETMSGGPSRAGPIERSTGFGFDLDLPVSPRQDFTAILPALIVGGRRVEVGPINFIVKKKVRLEGLVCS